MALIRPVLHFSILPLKAGFSYCGIADSAPDEAVAKQENGLIVEWLNRFCSVVSRLLEATNARMKTNDFFRKRLR